MKNKFYHISTYSVMRYWTILWMAVLSFSCSDFNPMDSYSRIPPDRNTDIDDGDEGDGAGGLFEKGYGTMNKPYLVMDVIQIQNMSEALVKGKMIYFQLGADIDMKSVSNWEPLNSNGDYYIYFDGNNHIIKNFTCTDKAYASFFGILAGTCKNVGFYNAHVEAATELGNSPGNWQPTAVPIIWTASLSMMNIRTHQTFQTHGLQDHQLMRVHD